jgi:LDH2 family malate/lactate/ureidoglycolate dehydrogenase
MYGELDKPRNLGHFMLALDPARFAQRKAFLSQIALFLDEIRAEGALAPGDPERRNAAQRMREGIPLGEATVEELNRLADEAGVDKL